MIHSFGGLAQMGERQLCKLDVTGSIPVSSIHEFTSRAAIGREDISAIGARVERRFLTIKERCEEEREKLKDVFKSVVEQRQRNQSMESTGCRMRPWTRPTQGNGDRRLS